MIGRPWRFSSVPLFASDALDRLADYKGYREAEPYPHLVLDGLFNPEALRVILREWPEKDPKTHETHDDGTYVKKKIGTTWRTKFGRQTLGYFSELGGPQFLQALEAATGIPGLMPDPYLLGGGLHATQSGGRLAVHADYNQHLIWKVDRRLNLLTYLNEGWTEKNAGWLELWDSEMKACVKRVLPVFNRTVIFSTTSFSWHGQPEPIVGPPKLRRKSIALYYFSNGRPDEEDWSGSTEEHSTIWRERPDAGY